MDVDETQSRQPEHGIREDLPVGSDDPEIGPKVAKSGKKGIVAKALGLKDLQACSNGGILDGSGPRFVPTTARPIWLGDDS
jgi:hypothetical protein